MQQNLKAKDQELQIWRLRCEKELKEKGKSGTLKERSPIKKDEVNHMK